MKIHNGASTDGDLLEKFCNTTHPEPLTSPANELTLHFHTDTDGTDTGFQIHYSLIEGIQGCGGTFTSLDGEFGSPIQNGQYPKNLECHYLIRMPRRNETGIKLTFLSFKLELSSNCNFDYVEVSIENHSMEGNFFKIKNVFFSPFDRFTMERMKMHQKLEDGVAFKHRPHFHRIRERFWLFSVLISRSVAMDSD